jgi:hypothetical protein
MDTAALFQSLMDELPTAEACNRLQQLVDDTFYCAFEDGFQEGVRCASTGESESVLFHYTEFMERVSDLGPAVEQADGLPV